MCFAWGLFNIPKIMDSCLDHPWAARLGRTAFVSEDSYRNVKFHSYVKSTSQQRCGFLSQGRYHSTLIGNKIENTHAVARGEKE